MNRKQRAAFLSILSNLSITLLKVAAGLASNSISVITEAIHSAMDLVSALIAFVTLGRSSQPADRTHPYGHGKFESLSGLVEAALIAGAGVYIIWEAIERLTHPRSLQWVPYSIAVMFFSGIVNFLVFRHNMKIARETESIALEVNAAHLSADTYTSLGVFAGLILISLTGVVALDPIAAILVAFFILKASVDLMRRALRDLMDWRLPQDEEKAIRNILQDHYTQFIEFHKLRTRKAGPERYIDLHLVFAKSVDLQTAHDLCSHLEEDIKNRFPRSQTIIHIEPCETACQGCIRTCPRNGLPREGKGGSKGLVH
jgi:cation diffusion facilitator family transporter